MARILVVDDHPDFCEALQRYLSQMGHQVICAADGRAALKMLMHEDPELILLDLKMPTMDGVAFIRVARSYLRFQQTPIIVLTGVDDANKLAEVEAHGVNGVLMKGQLELADVRQAVEKALLP
jgi:CheY-like chemotaxis protein